MADFWSKVDTSGGIDSCWPFTGARDCNGYGRLNKTAHGHILAHRCAAAVAGLRLSEAVMHECDNPPCCNPLHLTPADRLANNRQAWERGLHPFGERHPSARLSDRDVALIKEATAVGVTQRDLARAFGVDQSHICKLVRGQRRTRKGGQ